MLLLLILLVFFDTIQGYQRYAEPIRLATPNSDGVYHFDMIVTKKLTMAFKNDNEFGHGTPVDYNPSREQWSKRNPDQLVPCHQNFTMQLSIFKDMDALEDVSLIDGLHRRVFAINGLSPGPLIVVPYMSEVVLRVQNHVLLDGISIHVHGIDKYGQWYMDGVSYIQQCPIASMSLFEYRFIADNKGTHWYHGHTQTDRGDGLVGGFIVMDGPTKIVTNKKGKIEKPSREYFAVLQDWATEDSETQWLSLDEKVMKWMYGFENNDKCWQPTRTTDGGNVGGAVPISAILINDKGWHVHDDVIKRPHKLPVERFKIKKNEPVLFRVINGGVSQGLMVHFEGHKLTIVAADGNEVVPFEVDRLIIFPGERYDIFIRGLAEPKKKSYIFQIETIQRYYFDWTTIATTYGVGFLEYEDVLAEPVYRPPSYQHTDCKPDKKCTVLNCPFVRYPMEWNFTCIPFDKLESPHPETIDKEILQDKPFTSGYEEHFINMHFDSHVEGFKYEFPSGMPYYYKDQMDLVSKNCSNIPCARDASKYDRNCSCFFNKAHKLNNIVQITLYNMGTGGAFSTGYAHPFHIHGHHFYVMKVGYPSYNESAMITDMNKDIACGGPTAICDGAKWRNRTWLNGAVGGMNTKNPSLRDTITLPVGGFITIRFRATNPGWWFAHCHLELHAMAGTAYAFSVGEHHEMPPPPPNFPHGCGYFAIDKIPKWNKPRMVPAM